MVISRNKALLALPVILIVCLFAGSCKKTVVGPDPDPDPVDTTSVVKTGRVLFHLHTYLHDEEVDLYNITYNILGRDISLSLAQFYLSDIEVVKTDGSVHSVGDTILIKVLEAESYLVGRVPVGSYKSVRFKVGLDAATNALDPWNSPDSTALNRPEMWFGTAAQPDGYVFLNLSGKIDTTGSMSGPTIPFEWKIGTDAHYMQVAMPDQPFTVGENGASYVHILVDYFKLFSGLQINDPDQLQVLTAADNNSAVAGVIADNIPLMFRYEP